MHWPILTKIHLDLTAKMDVIGTVMYYISKRQRGCQRGGQTTGSKEGVKEEVSYPIVGMHCTC